MPVRRTKCLGTKVTDEDYARFEALAGERTVSAWAREVLLRAAATQSAEVLVLAEMLAVRTIVLNLHFALISGETPTMEAIQRLIERVDRDKLRKAQERLTSAGPRDLR